MANNNVILAAQQIKNYCYEHIDADGCMESCTFLRKDRICEIRHFYPRDWYIVDKDKGVKHGN